VHLLDEKGKPLPLSQQKKAAMAVSVLLDQPKTYSFTMSVKGHGEVHVDVGELPDKERYVLKPVAQGKYQAARWYGNVAVPLIVRTAFSMGGAGDVRLVVRLDKDTQFTLAPDSVPDAIWAIQALGFNKDFAGWVDQVVPRNSPDVTVLDNPGRSFPEFPSRKLKPKQIDENGPEWKAIVELASSKYQEKRAELIKRLQPGWLYLGKMSGPKSWRVDRAGDSAFAHAGAVDRMFVASIEIEFRREQGQWRYVRTHAAMWFKGE
jgi:hypothetical protein